MRKRGLCCRPVSVCPFVMVDCIHMAQDIVKLLCRPASPIILVFSIPSAGTQFQEESLQLGYKVHEGWENVAIFD